MQAMKHTIRQLLKNPGFTAVAVVTLALGIGMTTAVFSIVNGLLLKPLPYPEPERVIALFEISPTDAVTSTLAPCLLLATALAGGWIPPRATRSHDSPMERLRSGLVLPTI